MFQKLEQEGRAKEQNKVQEQTQVYMGIQNLLGMGFEPVGEECPIPNEYPFGKENKALVPFILYVKVKFIWITKLFLFNFFN